jgi:TolB-like protein
MTAQLIYAPADRHLWAEHYERNSRDILPLENEVATALAEQMGANSGRPSRAV